MSLYYDSDDVRLHHGDALDVARTLPDGMARTIVTSPPYFGLRDYGEDGQIGAEPSVTAYVARMVELFRELRRVLTDDGTLWLNLGDSYASGSRQTYATTGKSSDRIAAARPVSVLPEKNLLGAPWRLAFALQEDGWILRSDIIWHKPNPMPESVTDRPTKSHEYLFLFSKSPRYFYDADAVREPHEDPTVHVIRDRPDRGFPGQADVSRAGNHPDGRNKRTV